MATMHPKTRVFPQGRRGRPDAAKQLQEHIVISLSPATRFPTWVVLADFPCAPSSFLFLVVWPGAPSNVLAPSSKARSP